MKGLIYNGDSLDLMAGLTLRFDAIIADPPDNIGLKYDKHRDDMTASQYHGLLDQIVKQGTIKANHLWLSYYHAWDLLISNIAYDVVWRQNYEWHKYIWRFTFGQHRESDCGSGYRTILRLSKPGFSVSTSDIRVASDRQTIYKDARANPAGRVPDDVWEFPRVTGNSHERREWHPTQHPEGVYARMIRMSAQSAGTIVDLFGGTGTLFRAAKHIKHDHKYLYCDLDEGYCRKVAREHSIPISGDKHYVQSWLTDTAV